MQVEPQITFKGLGTSPALEQLIRQRIDGLERMHPRITSCRVVVEVPHRAPDSGKVPLQVAVEVEVPGCNTIVGKDVQERHEAKADHMAPLNNAFDAVERQLERINDIQDGDVRAPAAAVQTGMVVRLFPEQNYGFVEIDNSPELYFTRNAVAGDAFDEFRVGMLVQVTPATDEGPMGPQASSVRLLDRARTPD
jgi:ribosome-associated translation inhibitor RaiA